MGVGVRARGGTRREALPRGRGPGAAGPAALTALWPPPRTWPRSSAPSSGRRRRPWSRRRRRRIPRPQSAPRARRLRRGSRATPGLGLGLGPRMAAPGPPRVPPHRESAAGAGGGGSAHRDVMAGARPGAPPTATSGLGAAARDVGARPGLRKGTRAVAPPTVPGEGGGAGCGETEAGGHLTARSWALGSGVPAPPTDPPELRTPKSQRRSAVSASTEGRRAPFNALRRCGRHTPRSAARALRGKMPAREIWGGSLLVRRHPAPRQTLGAPLPPAPVRGAWGLYVVTSEDSK